MPREAKEVQVLFITGWLEKADASRVLARARKRLPRLRAVVLRKPAGGAARGRSTSPRRAGALTPRQEEVLVGIATGVSMKEIARRLSVSLKTAETHRQLLIQRIGVRHVPGLVRFALRSGLVPLSWLAK